MTLVVFGCEQGSEAWHRARMGIPTASRFKTVLAKGKDGGASETRRTYLLELAGEIITEEPMDSFKSADMERGQVMEEEARDHYSFMNNVEPERVGFIVNGQKGCSPDALLGEDGILEIKTAKPHILAEFMLKDEFPPGHKAQCQGALWVAQREWIDIAVYWPKMPLFVKRATRDEAYIAKLAGEVERFNAELATIVDRIRRYGEQRAAA